MHVKGCVQNKIQSYPKEEPFTTSIIELYQGGFSRMGVGCCGIGSDRVAKCIYKKKHTDQLNPSLILLSF